MEQEQIKHINLLREAFDKYLILYHEGALEPEDKLLDYDFDFLKNRKWHLLADEMIQCDLRDLTNILNSWNNSLSKWHAWNQIIQKYDDMEAWELRSEFLDSLVHKCLLTPASIRDTITTIATEAFHQVRRCFDSSYKDHLEGEPKTPEEKPKFLTRRKKEQRLFQLIQTWPNSQNFIEALQEINSEIYIKKTRNYRNLTAHSIGPRLGIGHTRTVLRDVVPARKIEKIEGVGFEFRDVPGKISVRYSHGGYSPIDIKEARVINLSEFEKTYRCYIEYRELLEKVVSKIERT
ncbi:hypothetical protein [Pseudoalteromonas sp. B530]|uniref:hypothetical protein n=1 Tax=Pseudoalteromonas sp. B530 TaxID=2994390 RepID=UPI00224A8F51|nr:hypothetical protein [Pseudoalteromonas sp. B530]MCX2768993.1 hypothetical protein [Pseudoalteromonas sp. B530]